MWLLHFVQHSYRRFPEISIARSSGLLPHSWPAIRSFDDLTSVLLGFGVRPRSLGRSEDFSHTGKGCDVVNVFIECGYFNHTRNRPEILSHSCYLTGIA